MPACKLLEHSLADTIDVRSEIKITPSTIVSSSYIGFAWPSTTQLHARHKWQAHIDYFNAMITRQRCLSQFALVCPILLRTDLSWGALYSIYSRFRGLWFNPNYRFKTSQLFVCDLCEAPTVFGSGHVPSIHQHFEDNQSDLACERIGSLSISIFNPATSSYFFDRIHIMHVRIRLSHSRRGSGFPTACGEVCGDGFPRLDFLMQYQWLQRSRIVSIYLLTPIILILSFENFFVSK